MTQRIRSTERARTSRVALVLAILILLGTACANTRGAGAGSSPVEGLPEGDSGGFVGWEEPFNGSGIEVVSLEAAAQDLSFVPYGPKPSALGEPTVFESPEGTPRAFMAITLVFHSDVWGIVWLVESLPDIADPDARVQAYEARVAENDDPQVHTQAQFAHIREELPALAGEGTVEWVENGVQLYIKGESLQGTDALQIAETI